VSALIAQRLTEQHHVTTEHLRPSWRVDSSDARASRNSSHGPVVGEQLLATAQELQIMVDLLEKYPAEAQLIRAALEDGLRLGPMWADRAAVRDG
jgi:hypothetical protein